MSPVKLADVDRLSREEKLKLLELVLESLSREEAESLSDWEQQLLAQRLAEFKADPTRGKPWSQLSSELRGS